MKIAEDLAAMAERYWEHDDPTAKLQLAIADWNARWVAKLGANHLVPVEAIRDLAESMRRALRETK